MTPSIVWSHVEGAANSKDPNVTVPLGQAACRLLLTWHNEIVEAKNETVRENHQLLEKLGA